ncbi:DegT/DnrJ/EryC1/StrS family aminotransferase [uncultured Roseivirga sp.]|uniref:DegT/DnrJ/EryC1/StrS family aminotransferase n=1 Tax=uncultured Roseivirga sp. TaxID=543088 RepID=UPI000D794E6F|nr:DegT/DnrJ/EryC1/StrS family aminotransferase [uncultured Roseivirga sp.]PWL30936.1 MAG: pyridoxamine 5-phosphate oxidase [Roseivirga sp. XM-24bin3]
MNFPLATSSWGEEEIEALQKVISSNRFTMGAKVAAYEKSFADFFGSKYAVMVNSGSSANLAAIAALRFHSQYHINEGDEVIVPGVSWSTTYHPLQQYGLKLKFVDIDIDTLNFDLAKLAEAISPKTKLIFAVNLLGNPNDFEQINKLISGTDIILIEDNCESMGSQVNGQFTGTFGLMGTFSSFFSHHISTMEGGMVVTNDEEMYHILKSVRAHGWTRDLPDTSKIYNKQADQFFESFNFILPGYNLRPLEMSGAIGIEQIKKLRGFVDQRRANANQFKKVLSSFDQVKTQKEIGSSSWFGFSLILNDSEIRNQLVKALDNANIDVRPIVAGNFVRNKVIQYYDYTIHGELTNCDIIHDCGLFVGNHQEDLRDQIDYLGECLHKFFKD